MNLDALAASLLAGLSESDVAGARTNDGVDVVGVGVDVVDVARFVRVIERTPLLIGRVFTVAEWDDCRSQPFPASHAAQRFAAKEAALKALGCGIFGVRLRDLEVTSGPGVVDGPDGPSHPLMMVGPSAKLAMTARGVETLVVHLAHTEGLAGAVVVAVRHQV